MRKKTLTSKDLMIGDWYAFRGHPYKCTASDIASIAECEEKGAPTDISEIPLTPEILEKNFSSAPEWYFEGTTKYQLRIYPYKDKWRFVIARGLNGTRLYITIRYVHELQHCLKLVGIEKEIVL